MHSHGLKMVVAILMAAAAGLLPACGGEAADQLPAPADLVARVLVELDPPAVHVTWKDIEDEAKYIVERKEGSGMFVEAATRTFNITQYHDSNVQKGTTYVYRVLGVDEQGVRGAYSTEVTAAVP